MNASISIRNLAERDRHLQRAHQSLRIGRTSHPSARTGGAGLHAGRTASRSFFDRSGPIGQWLTNEEAIQNFLELPRNCASSSALPVNRPYLELAMKLSNMSRDKLRSVAEDLLDITL
ncbi:MAG: hypothetical protein M0C28_33540 [Candidatus Moduliflexus flocculans]|nr:hypothetical protein [Candidatus Moduliflexus flocculans]